MRVLWVPHTPVQSPGWQGCRQYHLMRRLGPEHDLNVVSWTHSRRIADAFRWGSGRSEQMSGCEGTLHTVLLAPNAYRLWRRQYPRPADLAVNQALFRSAIRSILRRIRPDVVVYSSSHHWTGFPPFDIEPPILFDYVDRSPAWVEQAYVEASAAVVAVSEELAALVGRYRKPTTVVKNGVDLDRYRSVDSRRARQSLGVRNCLVSLIGLTCSPRLYFVDSVAKLQREGVEVSLLIVGGGPTRAAILRRAEEQSLRNVIAPGAIPHEEIAPYFAATDVGLYPGDDIPYYWHASPLKIVEYSAAGAQVISSRVDMFRDGWPNVRAANTDEESFASAILDAMRDPRPAPDLSEYSWGRLAEQFDQALRSAASQSSALAGSCAR